MRNSARTEIIEMEDTPQTSPPQDQPSWEDQVERAITALQREVERLSALATKQGSHIKILMTERDQRDQRQRGARR
jgi:hypothetical protein